MANFVRIGKRIVNLDNVTEVFYQKNGSLSHEKPYVLISFVNSDDYISVYKESEPDAFSQLMTWMDEQPLLLHD